MFGLMYLYMYMCSFVLCINGCPSIPLLQAITKGFFAEFPQPVKDATEAIVNARWGYAFGYCTLK